MDSVEAALDSFVSLSSSKHPYRRGSVPSQERFRPSALDPRRTIIRVANISIASS
jgi:hypothetical protein